MVKRNKDSTVMLFSLKGNFACLSDAQYPFLDLQYPPIALCSKLGPQSVILLGNIGTFRKCSLRELS